MTMPIEENPAPDQYLGRPGLVLALPFLLLVSAHLVSWPWRMLGLPGIAGSISFIGVALLGLMVLAGVYATWRRLPLRLYSWPPMGLGALALLALIAADQSDQTSTVEAAFAIFLGVLVFVLIISASVARHGSHFGVAFTILAVMTRVAWVPVFNLDAAGSVVVKNASLLTCIAFTVAVVELGLLAWLTTKLVMIPNAASRTRTVWQMVGLVLFHGVLTAWHQPVLTGAPVNLEFMAFPAVIWILPMIILLAIVTTISRLRHQWAMEADSRRINEVEQEQREREVAERPAADLWSTRNYVPPAHDLAAGNEASTLQPFTPPASGGGQQPMRREHRPTPSRRRKRR